MNTHLRIHFNRTCDPNGNLEANWRGNWCANYGFKSRHPAGANFALGDSSVRFIRQNIDHKTYQLLGCRYDGNAGGASIGDY